MIKELEMKSSVMAAASVAVLATAGMAQAQQYVAVSGGFAMLDDSDNSGSFTEDYPLGAGVDLTLAEGTSVGWTTEFDNGFFLAGAYGWKLESGLRLEAELSYTSNDVDTHTGVSVGGVGPIGTLDAGVLITGSGPLEVSVGDLVADGQGSVETLGLAGNVYYDYDFADTPFSAYVGGGLGFAQTTVEYSPSGVGIIDDDATVLLYQFMLGGEYAISESTSVFGGYRYRATEDVDTSVDLFTADLDIENRANIFEAGLRFAF